MGKVHIFDLEVGDEIVVEFAGIHFIEEVIEINRSHYKADGEAQNAEDLG